MKILYVCPNAYNSSLSYYNLIVDGLKELNYSVDTLKEIKDDTILNKYDIVIFGYRGINKKIYNKKIKFSKKIYYLLGAQSTGEFKEKALFVNEHNIINLTSMFRINYLKKNFFKNLQPFSYSFYPSIFKDYGENKKYDIGMTGALHGSENYQDEAFTPDEKNIRKRIYNKLNKLKDIYKIYLKCSDIGHKESKIISDVEYAKTINTSRIWISCHAAYGDNCRNFQIPPCRTLLFCNEPVEEEPYKNIFKNNENCVYFKSDLSDFEEKINYYLNNQEEYNRIVENGYKEFHEKHTNIKRTKELLEIIMNS